MNYFSKQTIEHLRIQQGLSARHRQRSLDITLACKLTLVYGKYHLMMDYRQLAISKHQMKYQEAERQAEPVTPRAALDGLGQWLKEMKSGAVRELPRSHEPIG